MSSQPLIRPEVVGLPDYNAGLALDRFRSVYGMDAVAKLDSNESPLGPSPTAAGVGPYPDASDEALRRAMGAANDVDPDTVIMGNGSEDLIGAIYRAVLRPGDRVVTICPSFGLHEFGAQACGAVVDKVPFPPDWRFPVNGLAAALAQPARILIFSSPSNPAGSAVPQPDFARLLAAVPQGTLVVFDEAYREYLSEDLAFDALAMLRAAGRPWVSLRTLSKAYGLAGARVGYGLCSDADLMGAPRKTRNPFAITRRRFRRNAAPPGYPDQCLVRRALPGLGPRHHRQPRRERRLPGSGPHRSQGGLAAAARRGGRVGAPTARCCSAAGLTRPTGKV